MYRFDDSRRPLYLFRFDGQLTRDDVDALERDLLGMIEARATYGSVWDFTTMDFPSRELIARCLQLGRRASALTHEHYESSSAPIPMFAAYAMSPRMAKLIQFFHNFPPRTKAPMNVFGTFDEAIEATERVLVGFGAAVPRARVTRSSGPSPRARPRL